MTTSSELRSGKGAPVLILLLCIVLSYATYLVLPQDLAIAITREDGFYEDMTAGLFLLAAVFAFVSFLVAREGNDFGCCKTSRNIFFILLGVFFFVAFGEEISWGQRIFGWQTPAFFARANWMGETNIHNINLVKGVSVNRLFSVFWVSYCVLLPFFNATISKFARPIEKLNVPVVPLSIGILFTVNYVLSKVAVLCVSPKVLLVYRGVYEIKEFNFGALFFGMIMLFFFSARRHNASRVTT